MRRRCPLHRALQEVGHERPDEVGVVRLETVVMLIRLTPNTPMGSVAGGGAADLPHNAGRVSGPVCRRGGVSCLPRRFPLAERVPMPPVRALARVRAVSPPSLAVQGVRPSDLGDSRHGAAPYTHVAEGVVLGGLPGHHAHAGDVCAPVSTSTRHPPLRNGLDDAPETAPGNAPALARAVARQGGSG